VTEFVYGDTISGRGMVGSTLLALGEDHPNVWGLTADVGDPIAPFAAAFPDRYVDVGIAEANLAGIAAGLALEGMIPFIAGMAPFVSMRALEQNRTDVCYQDLPVRFVGWGAGLVNGGGSTHNAMEDIALMKALVNMTVLSIGDPNMIGTLMRHSMTYEHPVYFRIGKGKADRMLYDPATTDTPIGTGLVARDGTDATIFAHGEIMWQALQAAEQLAADGISARVIDMYTIKPLDTDLVFRAVEETGNIVVLEDHLMEGGLASSIADAFVDHGVYPRRFKRLGTPQVYVGFGSAEAQWTKYGYDQSATVAAVRSMLHG
jgi:transketolase